MFSEHAGATGSCNRSGIEVTRIAEALSDEQIHVDPLEIEEQFGHMVDIIVDSGILPDIPSTILSLETDTLEIIRHGLGSIDMFEHQ